MRERGDTMSPRSSIWGMGILRSQKCKNKPTANIVSNGPERCAKDLEWAPSADIENAKTNPLAIELSIENDETKPNSSTDPRDPSFGFDENACSGRRTSAIFEHFLRH
jgi:hypothetical protein